MPAPEILINQLFAGTYLDEGSNIGHEIINLFDDDCGNRYLYITPSGRVSGHNVDKVVFVRNVSARRTVEVIAIASGLSAAGEFEAEAIRYGGVELDHIFRSNTYHGGEDAFPGATYKAAEMLVPAGGRRFFITVDAEFDIDRWPGSVCLDSSRKVVIPQGMRMYYSAENDPVAHAQLEDMLSDESLWMPAASMGRLTVDASIEARNPSFLEVVGKEDDELAFSNLLAYYFDYSHDAFTRFAADPSLLDIPRMDSSFEIVRESNHNIDLWIEGDNHVIVIENKIKSGINGIGNAYGSQLQKYRSFAEEYAREHGKQAHFYVFAPDYNNLDLGAFDPDGVWKVIPYSALFTFFVQETPTYIVDHCFPDFLRGLERHTMTAAELNFKTMRTRFMRIIAHAQ